MSRAHRYDHLLTDGAIALLDNKSLLVSDFTVQLSLQATRSLAQTNTAYYDERYGTVLTKVDMVDMICHLRRMADRARKQALPKVQAYNAEAVLSSVCCSLFRTIEENACDYFTACLSRLGIEERCVTLSRYRIPIRHQVRDILGSAQDHPHFRSLLVKYLSFTLNQWH